MGRHAAVSESRALRQAAWRDVNANIVGLADRLAFALGENDRSWTFLCECGAASCGELLTVTLAAYVEAREHDRFLVAPGHMAPEDRVIEQTSDYVVIELA
jgi:hypothetical protein